MSQSDGDPERRQGPVEGGAPNLPLHRETQKEEEAPERGAGGGTKRSRDGAARASWVSGDRSAAGGPSRAT